jgi:hypothetical protein
VYPYGYWGSYRFKTVFLKDLELKGLKQKLEVPEAIQAASLAEDQGYNSDLKRSGSGNISDFEEREELTEDTWNL